MLREADIGKEGVSALRQARLWGVMSFDV